MRRLVLGLLLLLAPGAEAQETAALIADRVRIEGGNRLVAEGAVEVIHGTVRLRAQRISYDQATGRLTIDGPITLTDGEGVLILADAAALDADLRNGILTSARVVLDQQLQLAANQVRRVGGRYTELTRTVASSCEVCARNPVPLWSIRARRVIHDQERQQLYFDSATFLVMDLPVVWLPRLRLPDPSLKRATGVLIPEIRTTSRLGTGLSLPYFVVLGDSRDVTFTPYLSPDTRTLELRYRQAYRRGRIEFNGAISDDNILDDPRGYLFGEGEFLLPRDFRLSFGIEMASDPAYLLDYDYSQKDRLQSSLGIDRVRRNERIGARVINFRTLRDSEIPIEDQLPYLVGEASYERRFPGVAGGEARLGFSVQGHERNSSLDMLGRDVARAGLAASWLRTWITRQGVEVVAEAGLTADRWAIGQDTGYPGTVSRVTPAVGITLRWPLARAGAGGARHLLQPMAQLVWSETRGGPVPNEGSVLVEFDESNLLSLDRFPGHDRTEQGLRGALGIGWTRYDPAGWSLGATVGRVFRAEVAPDFTDASGLSGLQSDWLAAVQLKFGGGLALTSRTQFDDSLSLTKSETRFSWVGPRLALAASHVWIVAEPVEGRPNRTHELTLDTGYGFTPNWSGKAGMRYDFDAGETQSAAVGLSYRNECLAVDLSLSRRFTSSISVAPTTNVGLKVSLNGFGRDGREFSGSCSRQ